MSHIRTTGGGYDLGGLWRGDYVRTPCCHAVGNPGVVLQRAGLSRTRGV